MLCLQGALSPPLWLLLLFRRLWERAGKRVELVSLGIVAHCGDSRGTCTLHGHGTAHLQATVGEAQPPPQLLRNVQGPQAAIPAPGSSQESVGESYSGWVVV